MLQMGHLQPLAYVKQTRANVNTDSGGLGYLLERTLCPDALPTDKDPVIPEAHAADHRAAQVRNESLGLVIEPKMKIGERKT